MSVKPYLGWIWHCDGISIALPWCCRGTAMALSGHRALSRYNGRRSPWLGKQVSPWSTRLSDREVSGHPQGETISLPLSHGCCRASSAVALCCWSDVRRRSKRSWASRLASQVAFTPNISLLDFLHFGDTGPSDFLNFGDTGSSFALVVVEFGLCTTRGPAMEWTVFAFQPFGLVAFGQYPPCLLQGLRPPYSIM